jgi:multimeric flavodoxin WrbA
MGIRACSGIGKKPRGKRLFRDFNSGSMGSCSEAGQVTRLNLRQPVPLNTTHHKVDLIMNVVAFCGSARKDGNTKLLLETVLGPLEKNRVQTELVELAGSKLRGCTACFTCIKKKNGRCIIDDDMVNECVEKMTRADAIILGSPTYFADVSTEMKALIDRCGMVGRANDDLYKRKIGAAVVAVRRAGAIHAFDTMNHFFQISQMIIVGSSYWNIGIGREKGEVASDEEGMKTMHQLGVNIGWLLDKLND